MALDQVSLVPNPVDSDSIQVVDGGDGGNKASRLPRWKPQEILLLIQAKRTVENRVRKDRTATVGNAELKWESISAYCKKHNVNRSPVQCQKRWSNLSGDFKKIKEWESQISDETESFWVMRNDLRKEKKMPGFFDKTVYDILDGSITELPAGFFLPEPKVEPEPNEVAFDSERTAAEEEDGFFMNYERVNLEMQTPLKDVMPITTAFSVSPSPVQISEKQSQQQALKWYKTPGAGNENRTPETAQKRRKRRRVTVDVDDEETENVLSKLIEVMERNEKMLNAHLEAQNANYLMERADWKVHADGLVAVFNKVADVLARIADKL